MKNKINTLHGLTAFLFFFILGLFGPSHQALAQIISTGAPAILFTDVNAGPVTGGPNGNGIPISIFGKGFGATQGNSTVTINGIPVASYLIWGQNNANNPNLDMIVVQPGQYVTSGAIVVTVNGQTSNSNYTFNVQPGNFYYVAPTGNPWYGSDSNNCSITSPCASMSHVAEGGIMQPGDTLLIRKGTYSDTIWIQDADGASGTPSGQIVIKNYPGELVTYSTLSDNFLVNANYITVSGINLLNGNSFDIGWDTVPQTGVNFYNDTVTGNISYDAFGINNYMNNGTTNNIDGNVCNATGSSQGTEGQCFYVSFSNNVQLRYNVANNAVGYGIHVHEEIRQTNDFQRIISNLLVEGNISYSNPNRMGMIMEIDGCPTPTTCNYIDGVIIRNNVFAYNEFAGLTIEGSSGGKGNSISNVQIYNNTFYQNGDQEINIDQEGEANSISNVTIENNILYQTPNNGVCQNNGYATCSWYTPAMVGLDTAAQNIIFTNNYYGPGAPTFVNSSGASIPDQDTKPITGTAAFVNPAVTSLNFQELPTSTGTIDTGTLLCSQVPADFNGIIRPQGNAYDIGAFEYNPGTQPTYSCNTASTYPVNVTTVGAGFGGVFGSTAASSNLINCGIGATLCSATVNTGTAVTLTATSASGSTFSGWTVTGSPAGTCTGVTSPCVITVNAATSVAAYFTPTAPVTYALTVNASNGTVAQSVNGTASSSPYTAGTVVTLTATPASGYQFSSWSGAASGTTNPTTVTMNANESVTANFTIIPSGPIALVQTSNSRTGTGTNAYTVTTLPTTAGNLLVLGINWPYSVPVKSITDNKGETWIHAFTNLGYQNDRQGVWYVGNNVGGVTSITVTFSGFEGQDEMIFAEYSGIASSNPLQAHAFSDQNSSFHVTSFSSGTASINAPALILGFTDSVYAGTYSWTVGSGFTQRTQTADTSFMLQDNVVNTSGNYASTGSISPQAAIDATMIVFTGIQAPNSTKKK